MLLVNVVRLRGLGYLSAPLKRLVMVGVRGMSSVLTASVVMPLHRVCSEGFDCACRAGTAAIGRPDGTVGAV
ncbi:hypothetical protein LAUMK13_00350 [Mycobacterium innocens]|uniref:Uncharacterized protein n=1 Tax=Mycobacterium innocens TaxID=2341083 RepID=A0A498PRC7_9MYCO|nr:hypothetical protein LAUMK13_00350 [Mycobacterium innocens]